MASISPDEAALQQMYELDLVNWQGGDMHWEGPHNPFCTVCGGEQELFSCQTCNSSYHATCMTPTVDGDSVPTFWFCPHCVNHNFHIPLDTPSTLVSSLPPSTPPSLNKDSYSLSLANNAPVREGPRSSVEMVEAPAKRRRDSVDHSSIRKTRKSKYSIDADQTRKRGFSGETQMTPKRKSKYSTLSSEVDKALTVIHNELELAAEGGRSESHLLERIKSLEQQAKLKDGQMALLTKELGLTKKMLEIEKFKVGRLEGAGKGSCEEVQRLKTSLANKESELEDWRQKLRSLLAT